MAYDYIRRMYGVDPVPGRRIQHHVTKRWGTIVPIASDHHYVHVLFDGEDHQVPCHPTEINYFGEEEGKPEPLPVSFQGRVRSWLLTCFGSAICYDQRERSHRFLEEAIELAQSTGCTESEAHQLVDYVFARLTGEPAQEVGGVKVTLAALCVSRGIDERQAGEDELDRVSTPTVMARVRAKNLAKLRGSPLPGQIGAVFVPGGGL